MSISPCLWFDGEAEEAAQFYVSVFPDSSIGEITRFPADTPGPEGSVMTVTFTIDGLTFTGLNGGTTGPSFPFTEAVSFQIPCADQAEVDRYWDALSEGGEPGPCGWLKDKFGLSWQVVPNRLEELIGDPDPARSNAAMQAMLKMGKIVVADLEAAADAAT